MRLQGLARSVSRSERHRMICTVHYSLQLLRSQTASQTFGRGHDMHALQITANTIGGAALLATPGRTYTRTIADRRKS